MKKRCMFILFCYLLPGVAFTSCNGQDKTRQHATLANDAQTTASAQSKLVRTQGSNQYQNVHCGLQDKAGNLWFGTTGEGIYRYDGKQFIQFTVSDGLNSNKVISLLEDNSGTIWAGTASGICRFDGERFANVPISGFLPYQPLVKDPNENAVWSIMQDKSGTIWFGTSEGVYCYNGKFFSRFLDNDKIINNEGLHLKMVDCILEDKNGIIWFGSGMPPGMEGVCRYDGKSLSSFKPNGSGWIRTILEQKNGHLLLATRHYGLCTYDGKNLVNITEKAGIDNGSVWSVLEDKAGNIWIGTELGSGELGEDGGLWRYDGTTFTRFTTKDGLCHNGVSCIIEDNAGNIWVGSRNTGLCRYDGKKFTRFSE